MFMSKCEYSYYPSSHINSRKIVPWRLCINKTFNFLWYNIYFLDQHCSLSLSYISRSDHDCMSELRERKEVIFNVTKRRIRSKSVMDREIESMNSRCLASLRISRSGDRAQLVITTRRQATTHPRPSAVHPDAFLWMHSDIFERPIGGGGGGSVRSALIRSHLCCGSAALSRSTYADPDCS